MTEQIKHYLPVHIHTDFSNGDALLDVNEYVKWAKDNSYPSICVTDHGNLCASLYFNQVANKAGIKSVIGLEAYCAFKHEFESDDKEEKRERDHLVLLAKNYQGYLDLCWLLGQAMRNTFYYKPIILYEELFKYNKNLIVSSACMGGRIPKLVLGNKIDEAVKFIEQMKEVFKDDFYIEIMEIQMADQTAFNNWAIKNYKRLGVKLIWTTDTHYLKPEHVEVHDTMKLINSKGSFRDEGWQKRVYTARNLWLKKREDIVAEAISCGYDEVLVNEFLDNTLEIDAKIEKVKLTRAPEVIMPRFAENAYEILEQRTYEALKKKGWDQKPEYVDRVKTELGVIKHKKMEDYFLIVADIVNFAEENGVLGGIGRGCFLPKTKIQLEKQEKQIVDVNVKDKIISGFGNVRTVLNKFRYLIDEKISILGTKEFKEIWCTLNHKFLVSRNNISRWIKAQNIKIGDYLIKLNGEKVEVTKNLQTNYKGYVYDLEVDEDKNYTAEGYIVHNSGAGSLVVHLLGITKIDPLKYDLFFERFLNEKRLDPPDIDLDFDSKGRYKIEEYLKQKYGIHAVSHVISFGTFGIKNAIRDTFRVFFGQDKKETVDLLSKCLENDEDDFDAAIAKMKLLEGKVAEDFIAENQKQFDIAKILVGKKRHYSMHAGGVIIAPDFLEKYIPIMRIKDQITTGYPEGGNTRLMTDAGLMKFDILGLNACTIINDCMKTLIEKKGYKTVGDFLDNITANDNDPTLLKQFYDGNTFSIFQFEGRNITKFIKRAKPTKFADLIAVNALYRPAVIQAGGLEHYVKNKLNFNEEEAKKDPYLNIIKDTYGIIAYQEQTMQVFQQLGGFTLAEADETRHVFKLLFKGNTDYTDFNHMMEKFRKGCHETTPYDDKKIDDIMELMKNFSSYAFNKCISGDSKICVFKKLSCQKEGQPNACRHIICSVKISELYENLEKYSGIALYDDKNKVSKKVPIKEVVKTGLKETYYVVVRSSKKERILRATLEHRFLTPNGWKTLGELKVGDEVLVKKGNSVNAGEKNAFHHSKAPVWNKGKKGLKFHNPRKLLLPEAYSNQQRSEAAKKREIHGHTGLPHTMEARNKMRQATIERYKQGKVAHTKTSIHKKVFEYVSTLENHEFVEEHTLDYCSIDIAEPNLKLAIEVHGGYFHSDVRFYPDRSKLNTMQKRNRKYEFLKKRTLKKNGWKLLVLWEHDINNDFESCKQKIKEALSDFQPNPWVYEKIILIEKFGLEETYDIHVDHEDHNYIANFFVVHNSHSTAYAMVAYVMMYLRTYHPAEYFSSLLSNTENTEAKQDGKTVNLFQNYVTEIQKSFKLDILKPDINESGAEIFRIKDENTLVYALGHIKDVGGKAALEIETHQPYVSFRDFLKKVNRRVVNKRVIRALVYSEAIKFSDVPVLFEKELAEPLDLVGFFQKQFDYTSIVASRDLKEAVEKEYSLKAVENAASQGKTLSKEKAIPMVIFISKFRRMAGNSKRTGKPYIMYFGTLYDGTTRIDDCILNDVDGMELEEGDLVRGKLYFEEAKNKKYSDHVFHLFNIVKVDKTDRYDAFSKFNIFVEPVIEVEEIKEKKPRTRKKKDIVEDQVVLPLILPKMISRKKINSVEIMIQPEVKMISRKKRIEEPIILISRKKKGDWSK